MATTKTGGKTRQLTPRPGKRLGLKVGCGQKIKAGMILVRQRGANFYPGEGVGMGSDYTLYALRKGIVKFKRKEGKKYLSVL